VVTPQPLIPDYPNNRRIAREASNDGDNRALAAAMCLQTCAITFDQSHRLFDEEDQPVAGS
jgi:hypothetical protein